MIGDAAAKAGRLTAPVFDWLDRFYTQSALRGAPIVLAVSGGADSMAMLHMTLRWARAHNLGENVHAVIIDHALRSGSEREAKQSAKRAQDMGARSHILRWEHKGVKSAVQERARLARYDLLAQSCRALGADQILVGHTQDDQAETVAMRQESGASWRGLAGIADKILAPIWPQTRGITIGRPLLGISRADIRTYCAQHKLAFFDDPSNENTDFQRVRMRRALAADPKRRREMLGLGRAMTQRRAAEQAAASQWTARSITLRPHGGAVIARGALEAMPLAALADVLRFMGGQTYRPDMARVQAMRDHMSASGFSARTLGGALVYDAGIYDTGGHIGITRDPGAVLGRRNFQPKALKLRANTLAIWDNRFEVETALSTVEVAPLWPARGALSKAARQQLNRLHAPVRRTLPGFFKRGALIAAPSVSFFTQDHNQFYVNSISFMRF